ncbi:MAG: DUF2244 domain-containing protein [Ectothiorhodospiraceae bacterium]|nr:DUF2244 domain-containing protein [Chromatiales bacterium]MCP5156498.1 DUF2244 domain-containing protein [Ectothiorhodospiraceae bacterium]
MVSRTIDASSVCRFIIRPNRSLTWRQCKLFFVLMAVVMGAVATPFALAGYWPVLPFAGLELGALGLCLWLSAAGANDREVVEVDERRVSVERGRRDLRRVWEADRAWVQVTLEHPRGTWYPSRLALRSHGREVALGAFLNEEERRALAGDLRRALSSP